MRKTIIFVLCVFTLVCPVFASDVQSLLSQAKINGNAFRSVENSYQTSVNNMTGREKIFVQVSQSEPIDKFFSDVPDASLKVALPEFSDDLLIDLELNSKTKEVLYTKDGKRADNSTANTGPYIMQDVYSLDPSVTVSKVFDLSENGRNSAADIAKELKVEADHNRSLLSAENSFYNSIISIMNSEAQLKSSKKALERSIKDYEDNLSVGLIKPGSVNDLKTQQNLESSKSKLSSAELQLEQLKKNFRTNYGIEYEPVTEVPEYDISFDSSIQTNTDLYLSYLSLLSAEKLYLQKKGEGSELSVSGSIGGPTDFKDGKYDSKEWTVKAGADLALDKFKASFNVTDSIKDKNNILVLNGNTSVHMGDFDVSVGLSQTFDSKLDKNGKPILTVSGSWTDSAGTDASLSNDLITYTNAQTAYDNALINFTVSVQNMESNIASFESSVEQYNIRKQYNLTILDYQTKLYELGYITERDYQDALDTVEQDRIDEIIWGLKGLQLANEIKTFVY